MRDLRWAAGLFEGEGCVSVFKDRKSKTGRECVGIRVNTTDEDTALSMLSICGGKVCGPYSYKSRPNVKPFWSWSISKQKESYAFLLLVRPLLGERRKDAVDKALQTLRRCRAVQEMME